MNILPSLQPKKADVYSLQYEHFNEMSPPDFHTCSLSQGVAVFEILSISQTYEETAKNNFEDIEIFFNFENNQRKYNYIEKK